MMANEAEERGRKAGLKEAANWLRRQANAEKDPITRAAFIEAHNAILLLAEDLSASTDNPLPVYNIPQID